MEAPYDHRSYRITRGAPHTTFLLDRLLVAAFWRAAKTLLSRGVNWINMCTVLTDSGTECARRLTTMTARVNNPVLDQENPSF